MAKKLFRVDVPPMGKWVNEWMNELMNERMNKWMNELMNRESINQSINQSIKLWKTWMAKKLKFSHSFLLLFWKLIPSTGWIGTAHGELGQQEIYWLFVPIHPGASRSTLVDGTKSSNDKLFFFSLWNPEIWTFFWKNF